MSSQASMDQNNCECDLASKAINLIMVSASTVVKLENQVKQLTNKIQKLETVIDKFFVSENDKLIVKQIECENLLITNNICTYGNCPNTYSSYQETHYYNMTKIFGEPVSSENFRSFQKTKQLTNEFMQKLHKRKNKLGLKTHKKQYKEVMKYLVLTTQQVM